MADLAARRVQALAGCRFLPGHPHKRFARQVAAQLAGGGALTERQAAYLELLCWTYRRQLPPGLAPERKPPPVPPRIRAVRSRAAPPGSTAPGTSPALPLFEDAR